MPVLFLPRFPQKKKTDGGTQIKFIKKQVFVNNIL